MFAFIERRILLRRECRTDSVAHVIANSNATAVMARSPPLSNETLCSCLPGGLALISIPQLSGSFSSSNDKSARPAAEKLSKHFAEVYAHW